jgi:hypothetical protein
MVEKATSKDARVDEDISVGASECVSERRVKQRQEIEIEATRNAGSVIV